MGTFVPFDNFKLKQNNGNAIDLDTDSIKVSIHTNTYSPNKATHDFFDDVTNEVSGTNYTAGGTAIAGVTLALDGATVEWIHNDITWSQSGAGFSNGRHYVWRLVTGTASTEKLIGYMTESSDFGNVSGDLILDVTAGTGVLNITG